MKTQLISSMASFVLGTGVTLASLYSWLGTSDLQEIKLLVQNHMSNTEQKVSLLASDYQVAVESANAEIGEYQQALAQANDNISQLITAYEQQEQQAQDDLAELQAELDKMQQSANSKYETDMNAIIEQANAEINQANIEVAETKERVNEYLLSSQIEVNGYISQVQDYEVNTGGDKSVTDISSVVPSEEQGE